LSIEATPFATRVAGSDLRIARLNNQATKILGLTTLDRVLHPHATVDEALAGYA
jgi:anti-sigma B factor antagonist